MNAAGIGLGALVHRARLLFGWVSRPYKLLYDNIVVSLYPGQGTPPMFGNYQAQRAHESLANATVVHIQSAILGFGLPPAALVAYHLWLCSKMCVAFFFVFGWFGILRAASPTHRATWWVIHQLKLVCPGHFAGHRDPSSKIFMRSMVILSDCAIYIPAAWLLTRAWHSDRSRRTQTGTVSFTTVF